MNKKHVIPILIIIFFCNYSCTIDEENKEKSDEGLIIGEWEGYTRTLVYNDGASDFLPVNNNCEGNILNFFEDGSIHWVDFVSEDLNFIPGETSCVENNITKPFGTWERISNGKYSIKLTSSIDESDIYIKPDLITFNNNGAETMDIRYNTVPKDFPKNASYYYLTLFKRK